MEHEGTKVAYKQNMGDLFIENRPLKEYGVILSRYKSRIETNVPQLCIHHSPTGFEWGYNGSGPADLALNIIEFVLRTWGHMGETTQLYKGVCFMLAWQLHHVFKREIIAGIQYSGGEIPFQFIERWVINHSILEGLCYRCGSGDLERWYGSDILGIYHCHVCNNDLVLDRTDGKGE